MTNAVDILARGGILRAQLVAEIAATAGLELAAAAAMLEKESSGGHNVWGHDGGPTGGAYVKGSEVTRASYMAYKHALETNRAGRQGVGPCQLTYGPFQDQADNMGGCWEPSFNMRVGFRVLQGLIGSYGVRDGFRRYNGSGPAAEAYAADMMVRLAAWRARLGGAGAPAPASSGTPGPLRQGDTGSAVARLQAFLNANYPLYSKIDLGPQRYGPQTVAAVREFQRRSGVTGSDADGTIIGPRTWVKLLEAGYRP
jgi:hypothetical protein